MTSGIIIICIDVIVDKLNEVLAKQQENHTEQMDAHDSHDIYLTKLASTAP